MKKLVLAITAILSTLSLYANKPDYGYLFSYVNGRGIAFAYSSDSLTIHGKEQQGKKKYSHAHKATSRHAGYGLSMCLLEFDTFATDVTLGMRSIFSDFKHKYLL